MSRDHNLFLDDIFESASAKEQTSVISTLSPLPGNPE